MTYKIVNRFIPESLYPLKATYSMTNLSYITIHNSYNDATSSNEVAYMTRNSNATSFHVAIDDTQAICAIPFNRNAWHCGDGSGIKSGNRTSIGIEICYSKSGGKRYADAEANTIEYTAHLLKQFGWDISRVKYHYDWATSTGYRKNCPHRILDEKRGDSFKKAIADRLAELNKPVVIAQSPKPSTPNTPSKGDVRMFNPSQGVLKRAVEQEIAQAVKDKIIDKQWLTQLQQGKLSLDDAFALKVIIEQRREKK